MEEPLRCQFCGSLLWPSAQFCGGCGREMSTLCPRCDHRVPLTVQHCVYCGSGIRHLVRATSESTTEDIILESFERRGTKISMRFQLELEPESG